MKKFLVLNPNTNKNGNSWDGSDWSELIRKYRKRDKPFKPQHKPVAPPPLTKEELQKQQLAKIKKLKEILKKKDANEDCPEDQALFLGESPEKRRVNIACL